MVTAQFAQEVEVTMIRASIISALCVAALTACATAPAHSPGREGLLDRWAKLRQLPRDGHSEMSGAAIATNDCKPVTAPIMKGPAKASALVPSTFRRIPIRWPLEKVVITSPYGQRLHEFHEGIDLKAQKGTPVYSAHAGVVLYADDHIRGYGNMVVIRHSSGLSTVYAHNSRLLVHKGQYVREGTRIALSGNTGHSTGPHLHFEVRNGVAPMDPTLLLPKSRQVASTR